MTKPFTDTLNQFRHGMLTEELTEKLSELVKECQRTERAGALKLVIKIKPGRAGQMEVFDDITLTLPKGERGTSIMFATNEGVLQRSDPNQPELTGLKTVESNHPVTFKKA